MDKQKEKQDFKQKLENEMKDTQSVNFNMHDDTSKFKVNHSILEQIKDMDDK